jgi:predicted RNase H-like HicB family nuclease
MIDMYFEVSMPSGKAMTVNIILLQSEEGYSVSVPELPGCLSQGETRQEALVNIEDAIREYLEAAEELLLLR